MAYLCRRPGGRVEIRESSATARGPRSRTLVGFRGALTQQLIEAAEARARRPVDRAALVARARALGIGVRASNADTPARALLGHLARGVPLDPRLAALLRRGLAKLPASEAPAELEAVTEWIGATDVARGRALGDALGPAGDRLAALERALPAAAIPHAFGGAIALAYYGTPRGAGELDVHVFAPARDAERVLGVLAPLGVETARRPGPRGPRLRVRWAGSAIDLHFADDTLSEASAERRRRVDFPGERLTILGAEDLAISALRLERDGVWRDLAEVLFAQGDAFDGDYARDGLARALGPGDPRLERFRGLLAAAG